MADLLASYYTLAGDVHPFRAAPQRPRGLRERVDAAAAAGFRGIGLSLDDAVALADRATAREVRAMLADGGLVHVELELLRDWFADDDVGAASTRARHVLLTAAERLGARHIKIGTSGPPCPCEMIAERFAALCSDASDAGTTIVMEFSPLGRLPTLADAAWVVAAAGTPVGVLALDLWHIVRTGTAFADIAALPAGAIGYVELCDGVAESVGDYVADTTERRLPCGEGIFDVAGFVAAVIAVRYDGPFGVEILSDRQRRASVADAARRAFAGAAGAVDAGQAGATK